MKKFNIFLSSPGDCEEERRNVQEIACRLNTDALVKIFTQINVISWDWGSGIPLDALASPQVAVNRHRMLPEECDLFLGIFNCKLGTPLPTNEFRKPDGKAFLSGSEYEFHRAWDSRRRGLSNPEIMIYRKRMADSSECVGNEQFIKLEEFFNQTPFKDSDQWIGSVNWFEGSDDFVSKVTGHIRELISQYSPGHGPRFDEWLRRNALILTENAGPRYSRDAHLESNVGDTFDWLMARPTAIIELDNALSEVWDKIEREPAFISFKEDLSRVAQSLRQDMHWQAPPDFDSLLRSLQNLEASAWAKSEEQENTEDHVKKTDEWRRYEYRLQQTAIKAGKAAGLLRTYAPLFHKRLLLLTGAAGQGKTHTLVHEINRTINEGGIAVGILGHTLSNSGNLWNAILQQIEWHGTLGEFLDKLENEATSRKQRAIIVFDALNETPDRRRWRNELLGMIGEILRRPHLVLAISIRSDYLSYTLPALTSSHETPWVAIDHPGFSDIDPEALVAYFEHFGVKAPIAPPIGELSNPLYTQLLAKSLIGRKADHWCPSWLDVWHAWMERLEQEGVEKLNFDDPSRLLPIHRTMNKLAQAMLDEGLFSLPRVQADTIAREITGVDGGIGFLCSAGALIDSLNGQEVEVIQFGYERLSDTFLGEQLLGKLFLGLSSTDEKREALRVAFVEGGLLYPLISNQLEDQPLRYNRSGLLGSLCLAIPKHTGAELLSLIPPPTTTDRYDWELAQAFSDSLRWRSKPEEFGINGDALLDFWQKNRLHTGEEKELDELIGFAIIPGHPLGMEQVLHPFLIDQESIGSRDANWSIHLASLWINDEHSNLNILVSWARDTQLHGVTVEVALPAARLLAWVCSTSQNALRLAAMKGLTRLLTSCPDMLEQFLPDFLTVNDPYVLEGVLVAIWGVILDGANPTVAGWAANQVYETQFPAGKTRWCHITLRHYGRCIVEEALRQGWITGVDLETVCPVYQSQLPLDLLPDIAGIEALDNSRGFRSIFYSASRSGDFFRYVMGGNSASLDFTPHPLTGSAEPERPYQQSENIYSFNADPKIFDLALAGRYIVWNTMQLGWTSERFNTFDSGNITGRSNRIAEEGRTERIGKKYQWISWHTLLGYLSDNYVMRPDWNKKPREYKSPAQVDVQLHDPARWLQVVTPRRKLKGSNYWHIPSFPDWPLPEMSDLRHWERSQCYDLLPTDIISYVPKLPTEWGGGPWLRVAAEHIWTTKFAPGQWALGNEYYADIWWQIYPFLIHANELPNLLVHMDSPEHQQILSGIGRIDQEGDWNTPISDWPKSNTAWDKGFRLTKPDGHDFWLPVPWRPFVGMCGHPDRRDEHRQVLLPLPSVFQEWNLALDLRGGVVRHGDDPVFALAGWVLGEDMLFANKEKLSSLLDSSGYALVWWVRSERRAFLEMGNHNSKDYVWIDYHGIAYLAKDGTVDMAFLNRETQESQISRRKQADALKDEQKNFNKLYEELFLKPPESD